MLRELLDEWKAKSLTDKINTILGWMVHSGAAIIGGDIASKVSEGKRPLERICVGLAGAGIGAAIGDAAAKPITDAVTQVSDAVKAAREKEGSANA